MINFALSKKIIGVKIREQRKRMGLTQFQLAELVGLHEKQISRIESGLNYPTFENFVNIITALNLSMSYFNTKNEKTNSRIKDDLYFLIESSSEEELQLYYDVINVIKNNKKNKRS
ncbi:MAG: helix-turn-helix transcriptional regulator [Clostridium sp.]|nr:helix-turn-helix transcriptional regulator [Clostridium sp.]